MNKNVYGACRLSIVPMRAEAAHRSEMVTQLLFLEHFEVLDQVEGWAFVRTQLDQYEGWIQEGQFSFVSSEEYMRWPQTEQVLVGFKGALIQCGEAQLFLQHGTFLPAHTQEVVLGSLVYRWEEDFRSVTGSDFQQHFLALAKSYHLSPYLWGGRSRLGIDCSGFSQVVFRHFDIKLPRDAYQQAELGETVVDIADGQPGDLAFFDNEAGRITHVGILINAHQIIHASGSVRIDPIDATGIYNEEQKKYSHKLRIVKRFVENI